MKSRVVFANNKLRKTFQKLKDSKTENKRLYQWLNRAFDDLADDSFCGVQIPKRLIPKIYMKHKIDNLWKYDLPQGWRLLYSVARDEIIIISIILEWMHHKDYEKRFKY